MLLMRQGDITAVYAHGRKFNVVDGTFRLNTYGLLDDERGHEIVYHLGDEYPESKLSDAHEKLRKKTNEEAEHNCCHHQSPSGALFCSWVDPNTDNIICMSILEIKGWEYPNG